MGLISEYILDGATLETSTSCSYSNGTPAPDGWYSNGLTHRYLTGGFFYSPAVDCDCTTACPISINRALVSSTDYYQFSTGPDAGVVQIKLTIPSALPPVGVQVNSTTGVFTNRWSSPSGGHIRVASGPLFLGDSNNETAGLVANSPWTTPERTYYDGTWTDVGSDVTNYLGTANLSLSNSNPGTLILPVSKAAAGLAVVTVGTTMVTTGSALAYTLECTCAAVLPESDRWLSTSEGQNCANAAVFPLASYLLSVQDPPSLNPNVGDFLFTDNIGSDYRADGNYVIKKGTVKWQIALQDGIITFAILCT